MKTTKVTEKRDLEVILKQNKQVLAMFCSSWCPFCQDFFPSFNKLMPMYTFERVIRVYLEDYSDPLWEEYEIEAVPTIILFENAQVSRRLDARLGMGLTEMQFRDWLEKAQQK